MGFSLGGLLGLSPSQSKFRKNQETALGNIESQRPVLDLMRKRASGVVDQFAPQRSAQGQNLVNYYAQGPEAAYGNLMRKNALTGIDTGTDAAIANARAMASQTGADPTSLIANLNFKRGTAQAGALTGVDSRLAADRERFMQGAYGTARGLTGQGMSEESNALGQQRGLEGQIYGDAGSLAQADETNKAAGFNRLMSVLSTAGSIYGGMSGAGAARRASAPTDMMEGRATQQPSSGYAPVPETGNWDEYGNDLSPGPSSSALPMTASRQGSYADPMSFGGITLPGLKQGRARAPRSVLSLVGGNLPR